MKRLVYATAATAALALVAGCGGPGGDAGAGQEGKEIVIGVLADLTGATADVGKPYNEGVLAYVDKINTAGGVKGSKIKALSEDYAYRVPTAEEKYKRFVSEQAVAIQGWGTGDSEALRTKVKDDQLPFMSASYAEVLTDPTQSPYNFVVAPTYSDQMRVALDYIAAQDPAAQVAVFHNDSPFGTAPLADGEKWLKDKGYRLGFKAYPMKTGATDQIGLLQQAKAQGAKYIVIQNVSSPAAVVARDIAAQQLDMRIICLNWCADELFVKTAAAAAEGHVMVQPFAPPSAGKPGLQEVRQYCQSKGIDLDAKGLHFVQGWYTMQVMVKGIEKVLNDGTELTGPNLRTALETMPAVDTGGVTGPIKFSAQSHRGSTASGIYRVTGGKLTEVSAAVVPKT
ncbi:MAG TPA: ABC transporter substrate-binding protein [Actinophytocola sp.]|jgi:branched-chain amino acid transport system substrate-binding protein|uniref:ABC transporter substrate-binding protein n=1 Tax=Actinophytocola sp. TaxID=1872138 RepID=UPI002DFB98EC|nr:ABC transporter substrate-binding protein [Actinophytocola sp.]